MQILAARCFGGGLDGGSFGLQNECDAVLKRQARLSSDMQPGVTNQVFFPGPPAKTAGDCLARENEMLRHRFQNCLLVAFQRR